LQLIKERPYSYFATSLYSVLEMTDEAVENIRVGMEEGSKHLNIYLYPYPYLVNNPCYDNLRKDFRFKEISREEKKRYDERRKKYGKL
jgi:hypothetical protein